MPAQDSPKSRRKRRALAKGSLEALSSESLTHLHLENPQSVRDRSPAEDMIALIATRDEYKLIEDLVPTTAESDTFEETGHCEYRFRHIAENGKAYNVQMIVLGGQGELLANAVLMNALYSRKSRPLLVVSIGISMSLSKDVKLGDVIFPSTIERYLERTRVEDVGKPGEDPTGYELKFAGGHSIELPTIPKLHHFPHNPAQRAVYEAWQKECAEDSKSEMTEAGFNLAVKEGKMNAMPSHHVGFVHSGPLLIDSRIFKEKLQKEKGRLGLGLDMESGGLVFCVKSIKQKRRPFLAMVVRGASDLGDGTKKISESASTMPSSGSGVQTPPTAFRRAAMRNAYRAMLMLCNAGWCDNPN